MTTIDQSMLDEIVRRIVATAAPTRIVLFGSAARGTMGPSSDFDFLVVVRDGVHRRKTAQAIYGSLFGLGIPKDVIVVTESDLTQFKDDPGMVILPALTEGKTLYAA